MSPLPELKYEPIKREVAIGDLVSTLVEKIVAPQKSRLDPVLAVWHESLPPELGSHCAVTGLSGSTLQVRVDASVYMYELQVCVPALVQELKRRCPQAGIRTIRLSLK